MNAFLALVVAGRVVAALTVGGSTAPDPQQGGFSAVPEVQESPAYYRRVFSAVDHGAVDVWICGVNQSSLWTDPLRKAALGVMHQNAMVFPDRFDSAIFRLSDKRNWIYAEFMFPDPSGVNEKIRPWIDVAAASDAAAINDLEKVRRWGKAWHEVMRRGFAGEPTSSEAAHIPLP